MKRVLVTGVDGFTGRHLVPVLAAQGHQVHGLAMQDPTPPVKGLAALHLANLSDTPRLGQVVTDAMPDWVVHLAAIAFVADRNVDAMYAVNLVGTRNLLEALASSTTAPRAVLLASSANIYGNAVAGTLDEATPPSPANDYAVSKLAMEYMAHLYATRLPLVICRPFNYTGIGQSESFLLPKIVAHARRRSQQIELGNVDVARDFSDVRDVVTTYARLLTTDAAIGRTVNVCSGVAYTLRDVLALVEGLAGHRLPVVVNPALVRPNEVRTLLGDRGLLDKLAPGLPSTIPLIDTLRWMFDNASR